MWILSFFGLDIQNETRPEENPGILTYHYFRLSLTAALVHTSLPILPIALTKRK